MLTLNKKYVSKIGNVVKILEKNSIDDKEGRPITVYHGHYEKTINGHEQLRGKVHKFFEDGKWFTFPGGIHDLAREFE